MVLFLLPYDMWEKARLELRGTDALRNGDRDDEHPAVIRTAQLVGIYNDKDLLVSRVASSDDRPPCALRLACHYPCYARRMDLNGARASAEGS